MKFLDKYNNNLTKNYCFNNEFENAKENSLMDAIDRINKAYGKMTIFPASNGNRQNYFPKQKYLSPRYTTQINELMKVVA